MIVHKLLDRGQSRIWRRVDKAGSQQVKSNSRQNLSSQLVIIDSRIAGLATLPNALSRLNCKISCFLGTKMSNLALRKRQPLLFRISTPDVGFV